MVARWVVGWTVVVGGGWGCVGVRLGEGERALI